MFLSHFCQPKPVTEATWHLISFNMIIKQSKWHLRQGYQGPGCRGTCVKVQERTAGDALGWRDEIETQKSNFSLQNGFNNLPTSHSVTLNVHRNAGTLAFFLFLFLSPYCSCLPAVLSTLWVSSRCFIKSAKKHTLRFWIFFICISSKKK